MKRYMALLLSVLCILAVSATVASAAGIPIEPGMRSMSPKQLQLR